MPEIKRKHISTIKMGDDKKTPSSSEEVVLRAFKNEEEVLVEFKKNKKEWIIFDGVVYDVAKFKKVHPAGEDKIDMYLGQSIDEPFEEAGHSANAKRILLTELPIVGAVLPSSSKSKTSKAASQILEEVEKANKATTMSKKKNSDDPKSSNDPNSGDDKFSAEALAEEDEEIRAEGQKKGLARFTCSRRFVYKKLVTKEDPIYMHKILGFGALWSFFYRYSVTYNREGNLGLDAGKWALFTMALHMALSSSSLIFHVLMGRILQKPLIIWEEYRLHAIIFTLRCVSVFAFGLLWPHFMGRESTDLQVLCLFCTVMAHHMVVDQITRWYGSDDPTQTTVRVKDYGKPKHWSHTLVQRMKLFYAFYQISALGSHLTPSERLPDLGWNTLVAIQSSAFLMTLHRKGLVMWYTHAFWYSLALAVSLFHMHKQLGHTWFWYKIGVAFFIRTQLKWSKYVIWGLFAFFTMPTVESWISGRYHASNVSELWANLELSDFRVSGGGNFMLHMLGATSGFGGNSGTMPGSFHATEL